MPKAQWGEGEWGTGYNKFPLVRELKQQRRRRRRRRLRKRHLKSEFALLQTLSSKGMCQSSVKEKERCCLVFPSSTKHEFRHFHVVVVQGLQTNVKKKSDTRAKLLFC